MILTLFSLFKQQAFSADKDLSIPQQNWGGIGNGSQTRGASFERRAHIVYAYTYSSGVLVFDIMLLHLGIM